MSRASLTLLVSLSLGFGLAACGDDSSPGGGGETDTDATTGTPTTGPTGPTTDTPTTDTPTTDTPTTDTPTTGTTDATDPDTGSETTDPTGETEGETTGAVPMDADFRVNSINLLDPPVFLNGAIAVTAAANGALNTSLTTDEDGDGDLDLGFVVRLQPLDQTDGASEPLQFANATCTAPEDTSMCDILADTMLSDSTYTSNSGECYAADAGNLSPDGTAPTPTAGPCFSADFDALVIQAGLFALPLADATIAATYVGDPAGNLVGGNIEGFVSTADAANIVVDFMGQEIPLVDLLRVEDQDGDGWVFHLSFTAVATEWTGA